MKQSSVSIIAAMLLCIQFGFSSCYYFPYTDPNIVNVGRQEANHYYVPPAPTVPLLTQKNDLNLSFEKAVANEFTGGAVHAAFLPAKNIGLMTGYSWCKKKYQPYEIGKYTNQEFGAGYVGRLSSSWHVETYTGFGSGRVSNDHYTGYSQLRTSSFFLQPAIAVSDKTQSVQFGFFSKFSWTKFTISDTSFDHYREPIVANQMQLIHDNPSQLFWEPGFVLRAGWKYAQLNLSYTLSSDLTNKEMLRKKDLFNFGVIVKLNTGKIKTK